MRALYFPYTFVLLNWAAVAGLYHFALGSRDAWKELWGRSTASMSGTGTLVGENKS